jgi:hypothetical protein
MGDEQAVQVQPVRCFCAAVGDGDPLWEIGLLERGHGERKENRCSTIGCDRALQSHTPLIHLLQCGPPIGPFPA